MNRLQTKLIAVFLAATLAPLGATLWLTTKWIEQGLSYASTAELDQISRSLEQTGRAFYQRTREDLKKDAQSGRMTPRKYVEAGRPQWPADVQAFWESGEREQFELTGEEDNRLDYLVRHGGEIRVYSKDLGGVGMARLSRQYSQARELVERAHVLNLRRGLTITLLLAAGALWVGALAFLIYSAHRISRPIRQLTAGLTQLASGNLSARVEAGGSDEVGTAIQAFNHMADQLEQNRDRLVYLARLESWQALARKTAHEVKNSLTPIRLTMEEIVARRGAADDGFIDQAAQIVVDEVNSLERRVRAFSEFASEPPVRPEPVDVNAALDERIALLKPAHPGVLYNLRLSPDRPMAMADPDLIKAVLTNLLENAAHAAGSGGVVLATTAEANGKIAIEVQDSGPGLTRHARESLFEPTISFKKGGMGLGLSIARKSAVLCGGDIQLAEGELGGAAFRVVLPPYAAEAECLIG